MSTQNIEFIIIFIFKILLIFRQRGREGEREGEWYQYVVASRAPPTGYLDHNPGMCPNWESNWRPTGNPLSHTSQGSYYLLIIVLFSIQTTVNYFALFCIYPKELKVETQIGICTSTFIEALLTIA